ncbi:hypothetical protein ETD86_29960 [Nonomuraea turkmeniaca]|uniref:Uncharacterized protein n=1 Tax=Nonomuraea turkmeniaca TaxID=103838 RepID=A0A5S4F9I2_9ACTN|nr:hypothetical protein [Nonomuraea turkmeniaca]TMR13793.1 hypothetical protein ETD86_29960 [Nonomuraea turkmeniaca]
MTATSTASPAASAVPASELISSGLCTPACLVAAGPHTDSACQCRCRGQWHGVLADVPVPANADRRPWWEKCRRGGWSASEIDGTLQVCVTTEHNHDHWRTCRSRYVPFVAVVKTDGRAWQAIHDCGTLPYQPPPRWFSSWDNRKWHGQAPFTAGDLADRFLSNLVEQGRAASATCPPSERVVADGVRDVFEAKVIAVLLAEAFEGCFDGISRAISVLEGHPDPLTLGQMPLSYLAAHTQPDESKEQP